MTAAAASRPRFVAAASDATAAASATPAAATSGRLSRPTPRRAPATTAATATSGIDTRRASITAQIAPAPAAWSRQM
ncbi:MAG: hypothetical protein AB7V42_05675 [Thermoleophilia bacterium]